MEKMFTTEIIDQIKEMLEPMEKEMTLLVFHKKDSPTSQETVQLMSEYHEISDKINLEIIDADETPELATEYNIDKFPTTVVLDSERKDRGVRFVGIPMGHEINSLIATTIDMGSRELDLSPKVIEQIKAIDKPTNIKVFVTLGCPHCPGAVHKAHQMAMLNDNIVGEMVEAQTFGELSQKHGVSSVPHIVINDGKSFVGNQPIEVFIDEAATA